MIGTLATQKKTLSTNRAAKVAIVRDDLDTMREHCEWVCGKYTATHGNGGYSPDDVLIFVIGNPGHWTDLAELDNVKKVVSMNDDAAIAKLFTDLADMSKADEQNRYQWDGRVIVYIDQDAPEKRYYLGAVKCDGAMS